VVITFSKDEVEFVNIFSDHDDVKNPDSLLYIICFKCYILTTCDI